MSEHTPGPWRADHRWVIGDNGTLTEDGFEIACVHMVQHRKARNGRVVYREIPPREQEGNNRLIAAAPEMLAALLAVSTDNGQDTIEDPCGHADREAAGFYRVGKGAMDEVRRAIKKATKGER